MQNHNYWEKANKVRSIALNNASLVPLQTLNIDDYFNFSDFEIRRLLSEKPKHLKRIKSTNNPFMPWEDDLYIDTIHNKHVLILNKYPVQKSHMLLITKDWFPQNGWLNKNDWEAITLVNKDTTGLWFFNSCSEAGASQKHRHIQLLPRNKMDRVCPRDKWILEFLCNGKSDNEKFNRNIFAYSINDSRISANYLYNIYVELSMKLGIGNPIYNTIPLKPYNILLSNKWMVIITRSVEKSYGFSINALGFAGYLLATEESNLLFIKERGAESLLEEVVQSC